MKNSFLRFCGLCTLILSFSSVSAERFQFGDFFYQTVDGSNNVIVVPKETGKYEGLINVEIQETVTYQNNIYTVIGIGKNAFYGCKDLVAISLPSTIKTIGEWAFYNSGIVKVTMPNVESIDEYAFGMCSNLSSIELPLSLTSIGRSAFLSSGLTKIVIPSSVSSIGSTAFASCKKLKSIHVSNNDYYDSRDNCNAIIEKSSNTLIVGCSGTTEQLPDGITAIGDNAFYGSELISIVLPNTVKTVGEWSFYACNGLRSVTISKNARTIGEYAFGLCSALKSIALPEGLLTIGRSAFSSTGLTEISIPASVVLVGQSAFSGCKQLTKIQVVEGNAFYNSTNNCNAIIQGEVLVAGCTGTNNIPEDVTTIGENAFFGSGITEITLPNSVTNIEEWAFYSCNYLESISLSDNLMYVGEYAFGLCTKLKMITLPSTLRSLGRHAFSGCKGMLTIKSDILSPFAIDESVFDGLYEVATLYVPIGTVNKYRSTEGWDFKNIQVATDIASPTIADFRIYSNNGVVYIESAANGNCSIYAVSGQLMRKVALKQGVNTIEGLSKGIYIVNGQKIMVK